MYDITPDLYVPWRGLAMSGIGSLDEPRSIGYTYYIVEIDMNTVTVSPKFQVVIPLAVREEMGIRPGERLAVISFADRIELVPLRPMREMKGFLKGLDPTFRRDEDDRE
jgi:AbrB family looped-hinge helix DNA binding protein